MATDGRWRKRAQDMLRRATAAEERAVELARLLVAQRSETERAEIKSGDRPCCDKTPYCFHDHSTLPRRLVIERVRREALEAQLAKERERADSLRLEVEAAEHNRKADNAYLLSRVEALTEALRELCERVGDFKTAYTGEEGWRIIPDMLAAMEEELPRARAALSEEPQP